MSRRFHIRASAEQGILETDRDKAIGREAFARDVRNLDVPLRRKPEQRIFEDRRGILAEQGILERLGQKLPGVDHGRNWFLEDKTVGHINSP